MNFQSMAFSLLRHDNVYFTEGFSDIIIMQLLRASNILRLLAYYDTNRYIILVLFIKNSHL